MESKANKIYNLALKHIVSKIGNKTTFSDNLEDAAKRMLGNKFLGVVPADRIPEMKDKTYVISNLDKSDMPGSHWISIVKDGGNFLMYDSFGRPGKKILPTLLNRGGKLIDTDPDAEQNESEDNCGQRSLASLFVYDQYGKDMFLLL